MRKSREEAAETRKRIVKAAGCEFRAKGIVATGLADLMKAAGLTHGGFYKHFESKDQLVAEAFVDAMQEILERMETAPTIAEAISGYLSAQHRDHPASGCPLSAIGSELAQTDAKTRDAATAGFKRLVDLLAAKYRGKSARRLAMVATTSLIGELTMARVVSDPTLSAEILSEVEKNLTER
jgi:TetR/AcrR family transcriptional repressor of nem operon